MYKCIQYIDSIISKTTNNKYMINFKCLTAHGSILSSQSKYKIMNEFRYTYIYLLLIPFETVRVTV